MWQEWCVMNVGRDMPRFPFLCECLSCSDLVVFIGLSLAQTWHFGVFSNSQCVKHSVPPTKALLHVCPTPHVPPGF